MRVGNRQLKYFFKQLFIFMMMIVIVEFYFADFLDDSKYTALAQKHYGAMFVGFIILMIFIRGRQSFAYNDSAPNDNTPLVSIRQSWFFFLKREKTVEIPRAQINAYRLRGSIFYRCLVIKYLDNGKQRRLKVQINYLGNKSRMKLKKSLTRILEENQKTH